LVRHWAGLLGEIDHRLPFYAAAALAMGNFIYGWLYFPETLKAENRRPFDWTRANPIGALGAIRKMRGLVLISLVYFLWQLSTLVYPMIWPYFAMSRYGWSNGLVGASLAIMGIGMAVMQAGIAPRIVRRLGERRTAIWGGVATVLCMLGLSMNSVGWITLAMMPLLAFQSLVHPNLTAMMSRRADATTQGEVQGFASSVMAIGSILAPLVFNPLQAWAATMPDESPLSGVAFFAAAGIAALAMVVLSFTPRAPVPDPVLERRGHAAR
jgi:DHA1 family tetracycline resistance protein-like MFS transporter